MSTLNVSLINGPRHRAARDGGEDVSAEDRMKQQSAAFQEHLGVEEETLQAKAHEIDPEQLQQINEDFLHSTVALNALHEAFNSASKQNSVSYKGDTSLPGASEHLAHANRELALTSKELVLAAPPEIPAL